MYYLEKTILIIEENQNIRENLTEWLTLDKYKLLSASSGLDGINLARQFIPDLIICNITMAGINGYEVLISISNTAITSKIPFIFSTSKAQKEDRVLAFKLGADDYLIKPYQMEALSEIAREWVKSDSKRASL